MADNTLVMTVFLGAIADRKYLCRFAHQEHTPCENSVEALYSCKNRYATLLVLYHQKVFYAGCVAMYAI